MKVKPSKKKIIKTEIKQEKKIIIKKNIFRSEYLEDVTEQIFPIETVDIIKKVSFWSTYFFKLWRIPARLRYARYMKNPNRRVGVNLELNNGVHALFGVYEQGEGFKYRDKKYLFDIKSKYWVVGLNMNFYDFHEDICLPIKREIPSDIIKTTIEQNDINEVAYAINPATLERFERSKIAEGIMKGQAIDSALNIVITLGILSICMISLVLVIVAWKLNVFGQSG